MSPKNRITINLSDDEYSQISELSGKFHLSMAWLGRRAIGDLLEKYKANPDQFLLPYHPTHKKKLHSQ